MRKIVYYVVVSVDGYIEGPNNSTDMFVHEKSIVDYYMKDLQNFNTVIMGRKTYEYGYRFGLQPGKAAGKSYNKKSRREKTKNGQMLKELIYQSCKSEQIA